MLVINAVALCPSFLRYTTNRVSCPNCFLPHKLSGMTKSPQQLSREAIEEFRAIYEEEFGKRLSDDEVQEIALRLLRFFGILQEQDEETSS